MMKNKSKANAAWDFYPNSGKLPRRLFELFSDHTLLINQELVLQKFAVYDYRKSPADRPRSMVWENETAAINFCRAHAIAFAKANDGTIRGKGIHGWCGDPEPQQTF